MIRDMFIYKSPEKGYEFEMTGPTCEKDGEGRYMAEVSTDISINLEYVKEKLSYPENGDIVLREFDVRVGGLTLKSFLVCADGIASGTSISQNILLPLMRLSGGDKEDNESTEDYIYKKLITHSQAEMERDINELIKGVNYGNCAIFVDTSAAGFTADVKSWEHRGVDEPVNETVIQGPHEGFNEMLRSNTALIRKTLNTENLIMKNVKLGKTSRTPADVCYLKNVANPSLVNEVLYRLENIDTEYILSSLSLVQYIEDAPFMTVPQIITTERPDRVCNALKEGRVAIIVSGSSHALIMPATIFDVISSPEDTYLRVPYALLTKMIRMIAIFLALLSPAVFIAVINFHQELILTDILFALSKARSAVPFSSLVELLLMELSFELIKEASIRVPGPVGSTLGIVGGLILGQAAVSANIVSPITIIVVSVAGIASFAIPSYQLSFSLRFMRFVYTFAAAAAGFLGIFSVLFIDTLMLVNTRSFGVSYSAPIAPKGSEPVGRLLFAVPLWKKEKRPGYLEPKDKSDSAKISRKWKYKKR